MKNKNQLRELISETVSGTTNDIVTYYIDFKPDISLNKKLKQLNTLFEGLKRTGKVVVFPSIAELPDLQNLEPGFCYLSWEVILSTSNEPTHIKELFKGILDKESINPELICNYNALRDVFTKTQLIKSKNSNSKIGLERVKEIILGTEQDQDKMINSREKGLNLIISSDNNNKSIAEIEEPALKTEKSEEPKSETTISESDKTETIKLSELTVHTIENTKSKLDDCISKEREVNIILEDISSIDLSYIQLILSLRKTKLKKMVNIEFKGEMPDSIRKMLDNTGFSFIK